MKKLLSLFLASNIVIAPISSIISCETKEQLFAESAKTKTSIINEIFSNSEMNKIKPVEYAYLNYINKSWEHLGFDNFISEYKILNGIINLEEQDDDSLDFVQVVAKISKRNIVDNIVDLTAVGFTIENIFVNSFYIDTAEDSNYLKIDSTIALTVNLGWKQIGKILLDITSDLAYATNQIGFVEGFINTLVKSKMSKMYIKQIKKIDSSNFEFILDDKFTFDTFEKELISSLENIKGFKKNNINISIDNKTNKISINFLDKKLTYKWNEKDK